MSAVEGDARPAQPAAPSKPSRGPGLSGRAGVYLVAVIAGTIAAAAGPVSRIDSHTSGWATFVVLATCAAIAQLFVVRTTRDQAYHTSIVFLIAAVLLLPPELVALMGVVQHIPEWLKVRYAWYIQLFNICNYTLNALAAWGAAHLVERHASSFLGADESWALAGAAACVVFVVLHHVILAVMLFLARGHRPKETGLFSPAMLSTEFVLAAVGFGVAAFWMHNVWLVPAAVAPLLLIHRSLHVPRLEEEARVDAKTGLFNARHFTTVLADEIARAERFDRPVSLIMADLDLLRDVNNTYGHLAGDAVLAGVAAIFREQLRHYDVPARFGGEEFAIVLPETGYEHALDIAERIRRAIADYAFQLGEVGEDVQVTISVGVAAFPAHAKDANSLVHHADLSVYRAKLQGRNRVVGAGAAEFDVTPERAARLAALPSEEAPVVPVGRPTRRKADVAKERRRTAQPAVRGPRLFVMTGRLAVLVAAVVTAGLGAGVAGVLLGASTDVLGMLAVAALVGIGQAIALELDDASISVGAVGALAAAALFDVRTALALGVISAIIDWSARRSPVDRVLFNVGALTLASVGAAVIFALGRLVEDGRLGTVVTGAVAGAAYYFVNIALLSMAMAIEGGTAWRQVWRDRFMWLFPHYLAYGLVAGVLAVAYQVVGPLALAVAAVPLLLMRKTQASYVAHTERSSKALRQAAETIQTQNVSLEKANQLLRERSTAAMESLSATVDARDAYTAGHSRRVQGLALAIGRELGLSEPELNLLGQAALFHDIGKLAIPDAVLLKPMALDPIEWSLMKGHSEEGARIIDRLGFLADAVPAIRHHHERFDGQGYPEGLKGEEIPLGARIIHVADALDSMLTTRIYRPALLEEDAMEELRRGEGTQFCPRCVRALETVIENEHANAPLELLAS